jgi:hypothetical protein
MKLEIGLVSMDEHRHIALPHLYGAPAYARPPVVPAAPIPRPVSPDDFPIIAEMTEEDLALLSRPPALGGRVLTTSSGAAATAALTAAESLQTRTFSIRALADRIRGRRP